MFTQTQIKEDIGYNSEKLLKLVEEYVFQWNVEQSEEELYNGELSLAQNVIILGQDSGDTGASIYTLYTNEDVTVVALDVAPIYKKSVDRDVSIKKVVYFELNKVKKFLNNHVPCGLYVPKPSFRAEVIGTFTDHVFTR